MFGYHCTPVVVFLGIVMGWRSGILADEQARSTIKQCEQCEDKLNQNQKEMSLQQREINLLRSEIKQLENKHNSEIEAVRALQTKLNGLEESMTKNTPIIGVSYIRWGKSTCPNSALLVYRGHVSGNWYAEKGGGVNYLCLDENPWGNRIEGFQGHSRIYGSEFDSYYYEQIFSKVNNGGRSLHDLDVICVACYAPTRSAQMMIPGRRTCPVGWTMEYRGYLVTEAYSHNNKDFICMDEEPEGLRGSYVNNKGALFYPVEGACGSLPCPPYVHGWEITCVVCTK